MVGGRGENGEVILVGPELFCLPRMWEPFGVQLGVAEHCFSTWYRRRGSGWRGRRFLGVGGGLVRPMGGHERGHGVEGEGLLAGIWGWADLAHGGVVGGPWGPWGARWGPWGAQLGLWLSDDVIGRLGRIVVGGYSRWWLINWHFSSRDGGGWSQAPDFPCGFQGAGC